MIVYLRQQCHPGMRNCDRLIYVNEIIGQHPPFGIGAKRFLQALTHTRHGMCFAATSTCDRLSGAGCGNDHGPMSLFFKLHMIRGAAGAQDFHPWIIKDFTACHGGLFCTQRKRSLNTRIGARKGQGSATRCLNCQERDIPAIPVIGRQKCCAVVKAEFWKSMKAISQKSCDVWRQSGQVISILTDKGLVAQIDADAQQWRGHGRHLPTAATAATAPRRKTTVSTPMAMNRAPA